MDLSSDIHEGKVNLFCQTSGNRLAEEASSYCTLSRRTCCHALSLGFKVVCVSFASTIVKPFAAVCFLIEIESLYKSFTWTHCFRFKTDIS